MDESQKKFSTTKLSEHLQIETKALFKLLAEHGYIERIKNKWQLTAHGEFVGGAYQQSDAFGQFIIWPKSFSDHDLFKRYVPDLISATKIAERFALSPSMVNLLFAELGLIRRDESRGWLVSQVGIRLGGQQRSAKSSERRRSQGFYVMWPGSLLSHVAIRDALHSLQGVAGKLSLDGRVLPTLAEQRMANYFYLHHVSFACDKAMDALTLNTDHHYRCSFYLPKHKLYVDYFGIENVRHSLSEQLQKQHIVKQKGLQFLEMNDEDVMQLEVVLPQKLLSFGINMAAIN